jgi:hypothetical protein
MTALRSTRTDARFFFPWPSRILAAAILPVFLAAGCHSYQVDINVENRTGAPVRLLEVDYPSASFGTDSIAAGANYHYRVQLRDSGPLKVQYTAANGKQVQLTGPSLHELQQGRLQIVLLPEGKAQFLPQLTP